MFSPERTRTSRGHAVVPAWSAVVPQVGSTGMKNAVLPIFPEKWGFDVLVGPRCWIKIMSCMHLAYIVSRLTWVKL